MDRYLLDVYALMIMSGCLRADVYDRMFTSLLLEMFLQREKVHIIANNK